jgi:hypothetical protein
MLGIQALISRSPMRSDCKLDVYFIRVHCCSRSEAGRLGVFKLGIAIIKMVLAWQSLSTLVAPNLTTSMAISGSSQGLHQTCPAVFDANRCLPTTGSDAHSRVDTCSSPAKSRRAIGIQCIDALCTQSSTDSSKHPVSITISVCMFFPYSKNAGAEFVSKIDLATVHSCRPTR